MATEEEFVHQQWKLYTILKVPAGNLLARYFKAPIAGTGLLLHDLRRRQVAQFGLDLHEGDVNDLAKLVGLRESFAFLFQNGFPRKSEGGLRFAPLWAALEPLRRMSFEGGRLFVLSQLSTQSTLDPRRILVFVKGELSDALANLRSKKELDCSRASIFQNNLLKIRLEAAKESSENFSSLLKAAATGQFPPFPCYAMIDVLKFYRDLEYPNYLELAAKARYQRPEIERPPVNELEEMRADYGWSLSVDPVSSFEWGSPQRPRNVSKESCGVLF